MARHSLLVGKMLCFLVVAAGFVTFAGGAPASAQDEAVLFADDFRDDEIGKPPGKWKAEIVVNGVIEVVEAPELASGKAVRMIGDTERGETRIRAWLPDDPSLDEVTTIAIEHYVRFIRLGDGNFLYVHTSGNNLTWGFPNGEVIVNAGTTQRLGPLPDKMGWNRVRIVANREKNELYIFVNDMEKPFSGPWSFRNPVASWRNGELQIQHSRRDNPPEVLYGDIKVWIVDDAITTYLWGDE